MRASANSNYGVKRQGSSTVLENRTTRESESRGWKEGPRAGAEVCTDFCADAQGNEGWLLFTTFLYFCSSHIFFKTTFYF